MPIKSMKITEEEKKDKGQRSVIDDQDQFPFGLRLHIDADSFEKLEATEVPEIGKKMVVLAKAEVVNVAMENKVGDEKRHSISLQITDLGIEDEKSEERTKDAGEILYGGSSEA